MARIKGGTMSKAFVVGEIYLLTNTELEADGGATTVGLEYVRYVGPSRDGFALVENGASEAYFAEYSDLRPA